MPRARVQEVDYFEFRRYLQTAIDCGHRIEPREREAWAAYVREHDVKEVVMKQWSRRFEKSETVIIDMGGDTWDGYYVFSSQDETAYKWETE
ncbi:MAG: hypothetical protein QNJ40_20105 [Xanthomonadales bacterium]|nr:hypothetical protein [Xanthomonadales bacterium]